MCQSFLPLGLTGVTFFGLLGLAFLAFTIVNFGREARYQVGWLLIPVVLFSAGLGVGRLAYQSSAVENQSLENFLGSNRTFRGVIVSEPDEREAYTNLTVAMFRAESSSERQFLGRVLVKTDNFNTFRYGDLIEFIGKLERPENFQGDNGRVFNYRAYLAKDGIGYVMNFAQVKKVGDGEGHWLVARLLSFKQAFLSHVSGLIPEPHVSLLGGLVVGAKQALGADLLNDFRAVGVIHIVVLSGYNITIVAESLAAFFRFFLPRAFSTALGVVSIIGFAVMVGGSATVVRASIMALLVVVARLLARQYDITRALLLAGFLMLLHNPAILVFDPSFQLSFLATVGLIYVSPIVEKRLQFIPKKFNLREVATATIATQIFVLPFILYQMGTLSIVALPVNLLILPAIPLTMLFGFFAGMTGFVNLLLATPFAYLTYGLLSYELGVVEWFAGLPFAAISIPAFPFWIVILTYAGYFVLYQYSKHRSFRDSKIDDSNFT